MKFFGVLILIFTIWCSNVQSQDSYPSFSNIAVSQLDSSRCSFQSLFRTLIGIAQQQIQSAGSTMGSALAGVQGKFTGLSNDSTFSTYVSNTQKTFTSSITKTNTYMSDMNTATNAAVSGAVSAISTQQQTYFQSVTMSTNSKMSGCKSSQAVDQIQTLISATSTFTSTTSSWNSNLFSSFGNALTTSVNCIVASYQMSASLSTCQYTATDNGTCAKTAISASGSANFTALLASFDSAVTGFSTSQITKDSATLTTTVATMGNLTTKMTDCAK